ncbi:MAG TPA: glycosyltransferase family 39 protein [Ktedonobacteraceae bacterium]
MTRLCNPSKKGPGSKKERGIKDILATPTHPSLLTRFGQPGRWLDILIVLALFFLALSFNLYRLGLPSIWFDEALSITRARQALPLLSRIVLTTQPNMALYYFVLHFWLAFMEFLHVHATEAVVRLPSAFFSALGMLVLYFLARRFFNVFIAVFAALLYLLNTLQLTYAQETRAYTLQMLFLGFSWYALFMLFSSDLSRQRARGWWVCFVLSSALASYAHLFSELVLTTQALALVLLLVIPNAWQARLRQQIRPLLSSWVCIAILNAPLLYAASRIGSKTGWLPIPTLKDIYNLFLTICAHNKFLLSLFMLTILPGLLITLLAFVPPGMELLKRLSVLPENAAARYRWQKRLVQLLPLVLCLLCWVVFPVALSYIVSQKSTRLFSARYLVVIVPALILLVAFGITLLRWWAVQLITSLCIVGLCLSCASNYYLHAQVEDWRTGTQWLQQNYQDGDGLVCYDNSQGCAVDIEYYLQAYPSGKAHFDTDSPGYFSWVNYDITNHLGNYLAALDTNAIQGYGLHHARLFFGLGRASIRDPQVQTTLRWLKAHYHLLARKSAGSLTFYLFNTTTQAPHPG